MRAATLGRLCLLLLVAVVLAALGTDLVDPAGWPLLIRASVGYLAMCVGVGLVHRRGRRMRMLVDVTLVADAGFVAVVVAVTGGPFSPLLPLVYVLAVAVTALFGLFSGVRYAILVTVGLLWVLATFPAVAPGTALGLLGSVTEPGAVTGATLALGIGAAILTVWLVTAVTVWFTTLNERLLRRSNVELAALREATTDLESSLDQLEISEVVAAGLVREFGYGRAATWLISDGESLGVAGAHGFDDEHRRLLTEQKLRSDAYPVRNAVAEGGPRLVARHDPRPAALIKTFGPVSPLVLVPLSARGRLLGLLSAEVAKPVGRAPRLRNRDLRVLATLANETAVILDNARMHAELRDRSITDGLTGLYNHGYFQERLAEEIARVGRKAMGGEQRALSVVLVDLDHFKQVNDTYGHPTGDAVLRTFAEVAGEVLRSTDLVFRYGGEEFAVILLEEDTASARRAAERLRHAIEQTSFRAADGAPLEAVTASFGVATGVGAGLTREWLVATADRALYAAKRSGRNRVVHGVDLDDGDGPAPDEPGSHTSGPLGHSVR